MGEERRRGRDLRQSREERYGVERATQVSESSRSSTRKGSGGSRVDGYD